MCITENEREYLFEEITKLLNKYDYRWSDSAIYKIIDTWADEKGELITAFKRHPNYIDGKFMIAFDCDYDRVVNRDVSDQFGRYLCEVCAMSMRETLPEEIDRQRIEEHCSCLPSSLWNFLYYLERCAERIVSEETANELNEMVPAIRPRAGEKTSRCINRLCTYLGYNKHPEYNREFAKYADSLSPMTIKRHTILSINPMDYLTMSFGNSWASCHTIDKENRRCMPNSYHGQCSSGTISYMLDGSSMVFYIVDASYDGNEYYTQPKINRQMFHWGEEKLVQGRLYPQSNDGCNNIYTPYRNIVQEIMAKIFDFPNLWTLKRGTDLMEMYIDSCGTHYRDYYNFESCTMSRIQGSTNEKMFTVGHAPICIDCGKEHDTEDNINCCVSKFTCYNCGVVIDDEDDVIWIDGECYCRDCCHYCNYCDEYHRGDSYYVHGVGQVCEDCIDHYYYCDECHEYYRADEIHYVDSADRYVCDDCLEECYFQCDECEQYYRNTYYNEGNDGRDLCDRCYEAEQEEEDDE